jgi:hypothetical protein
VSANWQWRFIRRGGAGAQVVTTANPPQSFAPGDFLVLTPVAVPYASAVNRAVARGGRLNAYTAGKPRKNARAATSAQNLGFLAATSRAVKKRAEFRQFKVFVEHTVTHQVPGEGRRWGTGVIVIRPRYRKVKV